MARGLDSGSHASSWMLGGGSDSGAMQNWVDMWAKAPWTPASPSANPYLALNPFAAWLQLTPLAPLFGMRWVLDPTSAFGFAGEEKSESEFEAGLSEQAKRERSRLNGVGFTPRTEPAQAATPQVRVVEASKAQPKKVKPAKAAASKTTPAKSASSKAAATKSAPSKSSPKPAAKSAKTAAKTTSKPAPKTASKPPAKTPAKTAAKPAAKRASTRSASAKPQDLTVIKGVGPKLADILKSEGLTRYEHIARMSAKDLEKLDEKLGAFQGRWKRDDWVGQAKKLAKNSDDA